MEYRRDDTVGVDDNFHGLIRREITLMKGKYQHGRTQTLPLLCGLSAISADEPDVVA